MKLRCKIKLHKWKDKHHWWPSHLVVDQICIYCPATRTVRAKEMR